MVLENVRQVEVGHQIPLHQHHIVLPDLVQIVPDACQGLHFAPEGGHAPVVKVIEGGQEMEAAPLPGHIPHLAAAHMVQHALIPAMEHQAHIGNACVQQVGKGEVHRPVTAAEGHGRAGAALRQLPQLRALVVSENDAMKTVHFSTSLP